MPGKELLPICVSVTRIVGILLGIVGAVIVGLWGFPFTYTALQVNQGACEAVWSWSGFIILLVGFALQLIAEYVDLQREWKARRKV